MIRLLSTDFDGTLVDHDATPPVTPELYEIITELRRWGVLWAINTGRDLDFIQHGLEEYRFPVEPDFVLTNEREIFHRNPQGRWQDYGDWNRRCIEVHDQLFQTEQKLLETMLGFVTRDDTAKPLYENGQLVGVITQDDAAMDRVVEFLHAERAPDSLFHYQRNTIFLRFCHAHYSKGAALGELCRLTGVTAAETFTAGDHHNDLSMLDGRFARWPVAPSNAIEEVKQTVRSAGGYIANRRCSEGVVEALRYFFEHHRLAPEGFWVDENRNTPTG